MNYDNCLSTFKLCSYDKDNDIYLVDNNTKCFDLDKYFELRFKGNSLRPRSLDCIYSKNRCFDSCCIFIEFKNRSLKNINNNISEIYEKIFNSMIIFIGDNVYSLNDCANRNFLIIVYNSNKDKLISQVKDLGNKGGNLKGIERFKKYCFKDVYISTASEFDSKLKTLINRIDI